MYIKINDEPVTIEYVEHETVNELDYEPSFWFNNRRYMIDEFVRTHNNPWCSFYVPEYIHAVQMDGSPESYENPLYLELIDDSAVNVYIREE